MITKFTFYLSKLNKTKIIYAYNESIAVWKLLQQYRLVEDRIEDFKIIGQKKVI